MAIYVVVNHLWKWSLARAYFRGRGIPTRRMGGSGGGINASPSSLPFIIKFTAYFYA